MENNREILTHLRGQQDAMTSLLRDLVLMETPSTDAASQAQIRDRLKAEFEDIDYRVNLIPGRNSGGHVYASAKYRGRKQPAQLMLGHCDTVWPIGTLQDMPLLLVRMLHNPAAREETWAFVQKRWPKLKKRLPPALVTRVIEALPELQTAKHRREVAGFFRRKRKPRVKR